MTWWTSSCLANTRRDTAMLTTQFRLQQMAEVQPVDITRPHITSQSCRLEAKQELCSCSREYHLISSNKWLGRLGGHWPAYRKKYWRSLNVELQLDSISSRVLKVWRNCFYIDQITSYRGPFSSCKNWGDGSRRLPTRVLSDWKLHQSDQQKLATQSNQHHDTWPHQSPSESKLDIPNSSVWLCLVRAVTLVCPLEPLLCRVFNITLSVGCQRTVYIQLKAKWLPTLTWDHVKRRNRETGTRSSNSLDPLLQFDQDHIIKKQFMQIMTFEYWSSMKIKECTSLGYYV